MPNTKRTQHILVALLLVLPFVTFAQQKRVTGKVIDGSSGNPLSGASVQELSNKKNGVLTDSLGSFEITVYSDKLIAGYIGYEDQVHLLSNGLNDIIIVLFTSSDLLDQVVVSGNRTEKRLKELTMSMTVVQPKFIEDKNPIIMDEVINQIPGVNVTDDQINIRSGSGWSYGAGSRVTLLVDGAPLMNGDAGNVLWTFISADHVGSIEVLKGASSVLYGSSALNGVINIQTKWPGAKPVTRITTFNGVYSKGNRAGLNWTNKTLFNSGIRASDSRKIGKWDLNSTLELIDDDGYRFGDFEKRIHAGADVRFAPKADMFIGLRAHYLQTNTGAFLLWKSYDSAYNALDDAYTTTLGKKIRIDPFWTYRTKTNWLHKINLRLLLVDNNVDSGNPDIDQSNQAGTSYADYQVTSPKWYGFQVIGGISQTNTTSRSPLFGGDQESSNLAYYTQVEWKFKGLIINGGARFEKYTLNDYEESKPVFRGGLNYKLAKATFVRASYGEGYRFPTIAESFISTRVGIVSVFPNPTLKSETGNNAEVGIRQGFKLKKWKGFIDLTAYRMRYFDMMEFTFSQWSKDISVENGLGLGFKSVNTGNTQISGIDLSISGEYSRNKDHIITFLAGYTYSNPVNTQPNLIFARDSTGKQLTYINSSSDTTNHILKYRNQHLAKLDIYYGFKKWEFGVNGRFNGFMQNIDRNFVTQPLSIFIPGIQEGQDLNEGGTVFFDARVFINLKRQFRIGIIGTNLFNTEFMVRPGDMGPPRRVMFQIRKQFGG